MTRAPNRKRPEKNKKSPQKELMNIPIGIRTRNRPAYLDITLRSLYGTVLPKNKKIVVLDDCSDDPLTKEYLHTDNIIKLPEPCIIPQSKRLGHIPPFDTIQGLKGRVEVCQPSSRRGVLGGIFWCIDFMMERYPEAEACMVVEGDAVFSDCWYLACLKAYEQVLTAKGPNGNYLGLLTAYDRKSRSIGRLLPSEFERRKGWRWRSVKKKDSNPKQNRWSCGDGIGGVHYLVTRKFYKSTLRNMKKIYDPKARSGDTALQGLCGQHKFNIAATNPSFIQHIGIDSLAWPEKKWRMCHNFLKPFALLDKI